jgi:hypothetical protein
MKLNRLELDFSKIFLEYIVKLAVDRLRYTHIQYHNQTELMKIRSRFTINASWGADRQNSCYVVMEDKMIWNLKDLQHSNNMTYINGEWVPARPKNYKYRSFFEKIHECIMVWKGRAELFVWPENQ